jgi:hypothetical protein
MLNVILVVLPVIVTTVRNSLKLRFASVFAVVYLKSRFLAVVALNAVLALNEVVALSDVLALVEVTALNDVLELYTLVIELNKLLTSVLLYVFAVL